MVLLRMALRRVAYRLLPPDMACLRVVGWKIGRSRLAYSETSVTVTVMSWESNKAPESVTVTVTS